MIGARVTVEVHSSQVSRSALRSPKPTEGVSMPLTQSQIESKLSDDNLDELLDLWRTEQGAEKGRDLDLMAAAVPFSKDAALHVLDLCCGPGDVGRAIRARYPKAQVDCLDCDLFLISICIKANRRANVSGQNFIRDLRDPDWWKDLEHDYDVVATANALHWLDAQRVSELFKDVFRLVRPGGVLLLVEPSCSETIFAAGFTEWKSRQQCRYSRENWERFWSRANEILGYDHTKLLGSRDSPRIDDGMPVSGWIRLLKNAGFDSVDVLLRDADEVILAAAKS